ncbi:MAG TPA: protein kinase [Candidatus Dormibacteraeota bacterium]
MSIGTGTRLGPYEVQDFIGQGAMGLVYRAYHAQLARTGAVKVMQAIAPDSDSIARFRREAQAIAQMRHPNILNVFDFGEHEGMPYMIVEYVPGGSLANRLNQGPLDQAATLKYLRGIAAGLDHAHGLGIIHRDVKPANVLLEKDDTPVLADFGLAKLLQSSSVKSMTGVTTGTPAYMSPEQVTGGQVGPPADRYSLATIAYEMLTGSIPFDGEGLMEVLYAQVHREPPLPSARNSALSPQVDAVLMRGLAKDPAARWESCTAFVDALAAALAAKAEPAVARTVAMAPPAASTMPLAAPAAAATVAMPYPTPAQPVAKKKSRKGLLAAIAAAIVVVLLILGVLLVAASRPTLTLSASTVTAGDTVVVNASHVPANQNGEIQLLSVLHTFPFHANSGGNVSVPILVPKNIGAGDHIVRLCWNASCRASATLHVIEPVALVTPSPGSTPSTAPGASPSPGATPVGGSSPSPRASAIASPVASPAPSPKATPSPPVISISNYNIKLVTGSETVFGVHFAPGGSVTITFVQGSLTTAEGTSSVSSSGYFSKTFTVPATAVVGPAAIKVCGTNGCLSATVNVTLTG